MLVPYIIPAPDINNHKDGRAKANGARRRRAKAANKLLSERTIGCYHNFYSHFFFIINFTFQLRRYYS